MKKFLKGLKKVVVFVLKVFGFILNMINIILSACIKTDNYLVKILK